MNIPTIQQLYASIIADIESELNITIPLFGKSFIRARAMVQAARLYLIYLVVGAVQKNIWVDTCDEQTLSRFGQVKLRRDRFPATQGRYTVLVTGTTGATIPASTQYKSNDNAQSPGKLFILDTAFVLDGVNIITLRALEAGIDSRLSVGDQLTLTAPVPLVDGVCIVQAETIEPQAAETIEDYRQKIINAFRLEPQGGAPADYRLWSSEVQGVVNAYPYAASGETSTVNLFIEADTSDGVPTSLTLQAVEDNIELPQNGVPSRKPVTHIVNYLPISPLEVNITINDYENLTTEKENLIEGAISVLLSNIRPFVAAIDVVAERNDSISVNTLISTILSSVPGSSFGAVTMTVNGNTVNSFTFVAGNIPELGTITYVN
jgi:uncharacterized phage protein gp47/JayE